MAGTYTPSTSVKFLRRFKVSRKYGGFFVFLATAAIVSTLTIRITLRFLSADSVFGNPDLGYGCFYSNSGLRICSDSQYSEFESGSDAERLPPVAAHFKIPMSAWQIWSLSVTRSIVSVGNRNAPVPDYEYNIRKMNNSDGKSGRVAFLFLVKGPIPMERLWYKFFKGNERRYSIYILPTIDYLYNAPNVETDIFIDRNIPFENLPPQPINSIDAQRVLLVWALLEPSNQFFVLVSDLCVPIRSFNFVYHYLMESRQSFVDSYMDPGILGQGRYSQDMGPHIKIDDFFKGSPFFALHRRHALALAADSLYYRKFTAHCQAGGSPTSCRITEHYISTFFRKMDPRGISNYSVTYNEQSRFRAKIHTSKQLTPVKIQGMQMKSRFHHQFVKEKWPQGWCMRNGRLAPCFLFLTNVDSSCVENLLNMPYVLGY